MNKLEEIARFKSAEVAENKSLFPEKLLERSIYYNSNCVSLKKYLARTDLTGIIAEFKRKSPARGIINKYAPVKQVTLGYMQGGASALSVLTDTNYFGGTNKDLTEARKSNYCPILRKDFIVDAYQITEAKSIGADVILLIAAILTKEQLKTFITIAHNLGLEVIVEVHEAAELDIIPDRTDVIGVNNRNLKNMQVNLDTSFYLSEKIKTDFIKISESGIQTAEQITLLKEAGFSGFLIGDYFMRHSRPQEACATLIKQVKSMSKTPQTA